MRDAAAEERCKPCFISLVEKKVRKELRNSGYSNVIVTNRGIEAAVARHLLRTRQQSGEKVRVEAASADTAAEELLAALLLGRKKKQRRRILTSISRDACTLYARLAGITGTQKNKYPEMQSLLASIKRTAPDAALAMAKQERAWAKEKLSQAL